MLIALIIYALPIPFTYILFKKALMSIDDEWTVGDRFKIIPIAMCSYISFLISVFIYIVFCTNYFDKKAKW